MAIISIGKIKVYLTFTLVMIRHSWPSCYNGHHKHFDHHQFHWEEYSKIKVCHHQHCDHDCEEYSKMKVSLTFILVMIRHYQPRHHIDHNHLNGNRHTD